ncbi:MAG: hypothetical protein HY888_10605 [Deltaproteobacteria bacterium]|nr:hypothetical protein [Deltaproteobacteria bacterium]
MKKTALILFATCCISASVSGAAEKSAILLKLDASRAAVEALAGKIGENREAATDLEQARAFLKKATDAHEKGRQLLGFSIGGFGTLKPEAEEEIKGYLEMSELSVTTAASRLEKTRAANELETIEKQLTTVKAKVKVFEDRKAELEKLKADAAKCATAAREVETLKAEKISLAAQVEKLTAERGASGKSSAEQAELQRKNEEMKAEKKLLEAQIEKQLAEIKALTSQLDEAKKSARKTESPEPAATPPAAVETPSKEAAPAAAPPESK